MSSYWYKYHVGIVQQEVSYTSYPRTRGGGVEVIERVDPYNHKHTYANRSNPQLDAVVRSPQVRPGDRNAEGSILQFTLI